MIASLQVVAGLILLFFGAEIMVRGSVAVARAFRISPHMIGLTVIAFGTSSPELFVSLKAALHGSPGIAVGNVVGSNIANILLMIGLVGLVAPFSCSGRGCRRDGSFLLLATAILVALTFAGTIERWHGVGMLGLLVLYLGYCYRDDRKGDPEESLMAKEAAEFETELPTARATVYCLGGMAGVLLGAHLLVDGAIVMARLLEISEAVIGITMVAIGTSLPELATTIVAAWRKHSDVAIGNIIGSNIFNTLGVLGVVSTVVPLDIPPEITVANIWLMVAVTVAFVLLTLTRKNLGRAVAITFFLAYAAFISSQFGAPMQAIAVSGQ